MKATEVLAMLEQVIKHGYVTEGDHGMEIIDAQYDGDHNSASLILVIEDGEGSHEEFIISSKDVRHVDDEEPPAENTERSYSDIARDGCVE